VALGQRRPKRSEEESMCKVLEEMRDEVRDETEMRTRIEMAFNMLKRGRDSLEDIAEMTGLSIEKVRELASGKTA